MNTYVKSFENYNSKIGKKEQASQRFIDKARKDYIQKNTRQQKYNDGDEWLYDIDNAISNIIKTDYFFKNNLIESLDKIKYDFLRSYNSIEVEKIKLMDTYKL